MARSACLLAGGAPALLLFGCGGGKKAILQSQHGIQMVTIHNGTEQNSTYQATFAYDAKSGATVSIRQLADEDDGEDNTVAMYLWTGYVSYFLRNSSPPVCCRMPAPNEPPFPWVHQKTTFSEPQCNEPLLKASAFPACVDFVLAQAQAQEAAVDATTEYHVLEGHGVNEFRAELNMTQSVEVSPDGLLLSMNVTRRTNRSRIPVQRTPSNEISIDLQNESTVYTMRPGFPDGWDDLETWWKGSCGEPCFEGGDVTLGSHSDRAASALSSRVVVVI